MKFGKRDRIILFIILGIILISAVFYFIWQKTQPNIGEFNGPTDYPHASGPTGNPPQGDDMIKR